jgi:hypothetical protein
MPPLFLALALAAASASATSFEAEMALEREAFSAVEMAEKGVNVEDPADDLAVFDREGRSVLPPVLADLTGFTVEPGDAGWIATFTIASPLPEDPGLAVNFDVFLDRDGDPANNAETGVFRVGSDTIFMLLFGTKSKWHSTWWRHDPSTGRWDEQPQDPAYTKEGDRFTLTIPYAVLPRESRVPIRGFSLTSDAGITAIDIAPGKELPRILPGQAAPAPPKAQPAPPSTTAASPWTIVLHPTILLSTIAFLLGISLTMWWMRRQ